MDYFSDLAGKRVVTEPDIQDRRHRPGSAGDIAERIIGYGLAHTRPRTIATAPANKNTFMAIKSEIFD